MTAPTREQIEVVDSGVLFIYNETVIHRLSRRIKMTAPTREQIEVVAFNLVASIGNAVHLHHSDLMDSVDAVYPAMSTLEYESISPLCEEICNNLRSDALHKMWGDAP